MEIKFLIKKQMRKFIQRLKKIIKGNAENDDEFFVLDIIKRKIPTNPIIIEAGAHIGSDSGRFAETWKDATIYAFEPVPAIYKQLVANTANYKNIKTTPLALSDSNGETKMFVSSGRSDASSSLLAPKEHLEAHPDVAFNETISVQTITLDDFCAKNNIAHIDFMWLDMQGYELPMLMASKKMIQHITLIYSEVSLIETYQGVSTYQKYKEWMDGAGFKVYKEYFPWKDMGNVLFVKK
jgi:FkbM family methyltransferase